MDGGGEDARGEGLSRAAAHTAAAEAAAAASGTDMLDAAGPAMAADCENCVNNVQNTVFKDRFPYSYNAVYDHNDQKWLSDVTCMANMIYKQLAYFYMDTGTL